MQDLGVKIYCLWFMTLAVCHSTLNNIDFWTDARESKHRYRSNKIFTFPELTLRIKVALKLYQKFVGYQVKDMEKF